MNLNLEYYKIFYYVGKYKSITLAAKELSLSQPAVSQSVKHLEDDLGIELFVRTPKGVRLTQEGEVLFAHVARGYEAICLGEKKVKELLSLDSGEIRIGASDMTLQFYLLDHLEAFHEKYPKIKIRVTNAPTPETISHLQEGRIDFGVITTPVAENKHLQLRNVRTIRDVFVAGEKYKKYQGKTLDFRALTEIPLICLEGETSTRSYVESFLAQDGVELFPEFELATSDMLVQFAKRGLGVANVVRDFALDEILAGELFELQFEKQIPCRQMCIVTDDRLPLSAAANRLLHFLEEKMEK
ncbi:MAG: LysR family transcriptional regulator [Eubacterium sp.]|nr:LysR family transcriptional regulator [Eubacterium sp.]